MPDDYTVIGSQKQIKYNVIPVISNPDADHIGSCEGYARLI